MSRKAVHHHYASASRPDSDNVAALHSSSGSNGSTESGEDDMDIKWSDRGYTISEIVDQFSLPLIVRYQTGGRSPRTSLPIPFSISQEHILLFSARDARHLVATNINDPTDHNLSPEILHNDVTIPEDFDGLFVRPYTTNNGSELKAHQNIDSLVKSGSKGFLTLSSIHGILQSSPHSSSGGNYYGSHAKISYPSGSLFLIEDIQNWSAKFQTGHYVQRALPPTRSRSSSAARKSTVSNNSTTTSVNGELEDDQSSYVIASGAPATILPSTNVSLSDRKDVGVKENGDIVWLKMADEDDVFLVDKPPKLGVLHRPPITRSTSVGSNYTPSNSLFAKCKDSVGRFVYFPLSSTGLFIQVYTHPTNPKKLSLTVPELINSDTLPPIITFVYGKKMRLLTASGFLKPKHVEHHRSVLACSLGKSSFVFFEVPMASPMKFCLSLNKGLLNSPRIRSALRLCENKGNEFATDMKVIIELSAGPPRRDVKGSGSESSNKLEDIAEEASGEMDDVESNNSDNEISQLTKDCAELSLGGIIYI